MPVIPAPLNLDEEKAYADFMFLLDSFRGVLESLGEGDIAAALPWDSMPSRGAPDPEKLSQALSIAFQLASLAEENAVVQHRRRLESDAGLSATSGSWGRIFATLRDAGLSAADIGAGLSRIHVEPVLTAHPTEAKRATVLEQHRALYLALVARENQMWSVHEQARRNAEIEAKIERLWRTGEIFLQRPAVTDELRNIVYYLERVLADVVGSMDGRMRAAWDEVGLDPTGMGDRRNVPRVTFGTWVGGDRDGHPFVTADVTRGTLAELRRHALGLQSESLRDLATRMSLSEARMETPAELAEWVAARAAELGEAGHAALERNPGEPFRQAVNLMRAQLPVGDGSGYHDATALSDDLYLLAGWLDEVGAGRLVNDDVLPAIRIAETFGFHLAALDIRQNSRFHDLAVSQLLVAAGMAEGAGFPEWDEERRLELLVRELASPRPLAHPDHSVGPEADAVLSALRVVAAEIQAHGPAGIGSLIVSMTRSLSDLLVAYLLAKEAGLLVNEDGVTRSLVPVVPLFETIDDLEKSPGIFTSFVAHPITAATLDAIRRPGHRPVQQVMIGYSDSNKDGGIVASLWGLFRAQERLAGIAAEAGMDVRFFHGRGGTISRGAGPTHRFLRALPPGSLGGALRITEQGETISQKYANRITAEHHLELLLAGAAGAALAPVSSPPTRLEEIMDSLAETARQAYSDLLHTDGFIGFFRQATPIDVIERSSIGSRPARRTGKPSIADLRAIPWVFSWGQSRFFLSGWYGVGSALEQLRESDPDSFEALIERVFDWPPLHYIVSNVATSLATSDEEVMFWYSEMVLDEELRDRFMDLIVVERRRTEAMLERIYGGALDQRRPNISRVLALRRPGLRLLHRRQVDLLQSWRALLAAGDEAGAQAMLPSLLVTVNAIAGGLGATG